MSLDGARIPAPDPVVPCCYASAVHPGECTCWEVVLDTDPADPLQAHARRLVEADDQLLDDLIAVREAQGITRAEVAERLGCSESAIARIEAGERDPHLSTLRRYALAIGAEVTHSVRSRNPLW